jgi:hypothetical protein
MEAESLLKEGKSETLALAEAHLKRIKDLERGIIPAVADGRKDVGSYLAWHFYLADAEATAARGHPEKTTCAAQRRLAAVFLIYYDWWPNLGKLQVGHFSSALFWSRKLLEAENALRTEKSEKLVAAEGYLGRAVELEKLAKDQPYAESGLRRHLVQAATYYRLDAEILVAEVGGHSAKESILEKARSRLDAAKAAYRSAREPPAEEARPVSIETIYEYSMCWRTAALALSGTKAERVAANEGHLTRMKEIERGMETAHQDARVGDRELFAARYYRAQAELFVAQANAR